MRDVQARGREQAGERGETKRCYRQERVQVRVQVGQNVLARLGGDEFAVVVAECPADAVVAYAEQVALLAWRELPHGVAIGLAITGDAIELDSLRYWAVDRQVAYKSAEVAFGVLMRQLTSAV